MKKEQMLKPSAPAESGAVINLEDRKVAKEMQALLKENEELDRRLAAMGLEQDFEFKEELSSEEGKKKKPGLKLKSGKK